MPNRRLRATELAQDLCEVLVDAELEQAPAEVLRSPWRFWCRFEERRRNEASETSLGAPASCLEQPSLSWNGVACVTDAVARVGG